jgi:hypothetical protein
MLNEETRIMIWPIYRVKPNPENPRIIKDDEFHKLVKSLKDFPEMADVRPLIINQDNIILGGNMRFRAMKEAGWKECPVIQVDWSEDKQREFIIKDNLSHGEWDWDDLGNNWDAEELKEWGMNVWQSEEASMEEDVEAKEDDFEIPDEITTDIVLGDLFEIGEHRLLCGDSTNSDAIEKLMNGENADILTDPPYGINANKQTLGSGKKNFYRGKNWDSEVPDFFYLLIKYQNAIIWGGNYFADKLPISNDWLCWHKKNDGLSFSEFELAWSNTGKNCRILSHHWGGEKKIHPTMKPIKVIEWCIGFLNSKIILDPFLGSGSTIVACHQLKRKCYGMELDPKYCQVIINRMRKLDPNIKIKKNGIEYLP